MDYIAYDANHKHAVTTLSNGNSYTHDANGNMEVRDIGGNAYELDYDAENRLVSVSGTNLVAQFTYNGDGQRVKSVINSETIYFVNGYYEQKGSEITKCFSLGEGVLTPPLF